MSNFDLTQEGQYKLESVQIIPVAAPDLYVDVTNLLNSVTIQQSIFAPVMCGQISLMDSIGLSEFLPICGHELLKLTFVRPASPTIPLHPDDRYPSLGSNDSIPETKYFTQTFRIQKLTNKSRVNDFTLSYILHFVSQEAITNHKIKVCKGYAGWLYSDIVTDVFNNYCWTNLEKALEVVPSRDLQNYVVSNWRPLEAIGKICHRAKPLGQGGASYLFFEGFKAFKFTTIETLFEGPVVENYVIQPKNILDENDRSRELQNSLVSIDSSVGKEDFDIVKNLKNGMYGSRLLTFNLIREVFEDIPFDYNKGFGLTKHVDAEKPIFADSDLPGSPDSNTFLIHTTKGIDAYGTGEIPFYKEDYLQIRASQILQTMSQRFSITVPGNTEREAGQVVMLDIVSPKALEGYSDKQPELHKYQSGKYLIGTITHLIDRTRYNISMTLLKDTFVSAPETTDFAPEYIKLANPQDD